MIHQSIWFLLSLFVLAAGAFVCVFFLFRVRRGGNRISALVLTAAIIVLLLALDRVTKVVFEVELVGKGVLVLIPNILGLFLLEGGNTGGAWGIFSNATWLLSVITALALLVAIYVLFARRLRSSWMHVALALVTVGGLGNLYDRIMYGRVTDFLYFLFIEFPVFNVADCCVTLGAVLAVCAALFGPKEAAWFTDRPIKVAKTALQEVAKNDDDE